MAGERFAWQMKMRRRRLTVTEETYDDWFRRKVQEALDDPGPLIPHEQVMSEMRAIVDAKRKTKLDR